MRTVCAAVLLVAGSIASDFVPARYASGSAPTPPPNAIGWIIAALDVEVDQSGSVSRLTGLRETPGGVQLVGPIISGWRFRPALYMDVPVPSHVLVVNMLRPPQLYDPAPGSLPVDVAPPSDEVPFPLNEVRPRVPPNAVADGVVLVEILVGVAGHVERAGVIGSPSGFDSAALEAARGWLFRPARYRDVPVPASAYLIFGFRAPVV